MPKADISNIIRRINECLKCAKNSPFPAEAANALEKARKMMEKFNLSDADLKSKTVEDIIEIDFQLAMRSNEASLVLAVWIAKAFHVRALAYNQLAENSNRVIGKAIKFIGTKADIAVSTYIYSYMMHLIDIKSKEYFDKIKGEKKWTPAAAKKVKVTFGIGFAHAVVEKLKEIEAANLAAEAKKAAVNVDVNLSIECKAIAVIKQDLIQRYMDEAHPNVEESGGGTETVDGNHYTAGYAEGEKTGIHRGVEKPASRKEIGGRR